MIMSVFNELTKLSALPNFRSNITIQRENDDGNRICLSPITDDSAHNSLLMAVFMKRSIKKYLSLLKMIITTIDWKQHLLTIILN